MCNQAYHLLEYLVSKGLSGDGKSEKEEFDAGISAQQETNKTA
jgi:hypothetical protein